MQHCLLKTWDTESNYSANIKAEIEEYLGHYCWKCGQYLANEKFSGKGHARHICKKCMAEERAHRRQILKEKRERGEIPELKLKPVSQEVIDYVENEIIPRCAAFDKAHQESHVRMVIEQHKTRRT